MRNPSGNMFCVPVVNGLGMGIGFLLWGTMQTIVGWSVARFGLFGWLAATEVKHNVLNYIGMIFTLVSGVLFVFVKHNDEEGKKRVSIPSETIALESQRTGNSVDIPSSDRSTKKELHNTSPSETSTLESYGSKEGAHAPHSVLSTNKQVLLQKAPYLIMSMTLAILCGLVITPIAILKQRHPSKDPFKVFDYLWSFYSTIFVFSTLYFVLYCIIRREKAYVVRELVLPSVACGVLITSATTFIFLSGDQLSLVVAYPITTWVSKLKNDLFLNLLESPRGIIDSFKTIQGCQVN
ncbi:hypothetical protein GCK32_009410 [Trichostrongylus colubriformis]|uniref:Uncharacterized protein n=1 Tax=Trichostrongylus colubriformis TaxID=6319 RepID=A0AAN8F9Q8_TRICO